MEQLEHLAQTGYGSLILKTFSYLSVTETLLSDTNHACRFHIYRMLLHADTAPGASITAWYPDLIHGACGGTLETWYQGPAKVKL
jgi:hypothetical protein